MKNKPIPSPLSNSSKVFSFDDMKEVWYFAMIQGATLWQYSQDKKRNLPQDYTRGLDSIREYMKDPSTMAYLLGATPVVMGLYDEVLDGVTVGEQPKEKKKNAKL